ncbi:MAG: flagellar protein FlaG, partial [Alicyclobacillus sp.]|nr:flagellar protein FlaG [Alicyclobacillus sp.]
PVPRLGQVGGRRLNVEGIAGGVRGSNGSWEAKDNFRTGRQSASEPLVTADVGTDPRGQTNDPLTLQQVQNALGTINQHLAAVSLQVNFDTEAPTDQIWLNVVDPTTGQVVQKIPPEQVRELVAHPQHATGWIVNQRL